MEAMNFVATADGKRSFRRSKRELGHRLSRISFVCTAGKWAVSLFSALPTLMPPRCVRISLAGRCKFSTHPTNPVFSSIQSSCRKSSLSISYATQPVLSPEALTSQEHAVLDCHILARLASICGCLLYLLWANPIARPPRPGASVLRFGFAYYVGLPADEITLYF